jgi:putative nucleotidyltransferase with HDIG domain
MKNEELNSTYAQLKGRYMDTIEVLRLAVDAKDEYTRGHSDRVAFYATKLGRNYGLPMPVLEQLRIAGIFHDIGKIGTADDILLKEEHLNLDEYEEVKQHPVKGAMILSAVSMFKDIVPIVRHHHEYVDGTGYPDGLKGEEIGIPACIISVADAFDTMMSGRHNKGHLTFEETKQQLIKGSGTQFHPEVVKVFLDMLENDEELLALMGIIPDDIGSEKGEEK